MTPSIHILGAGSIGGLFAARLSQHCSITLISRHSTGNLNIRLTGNPEDQLVVSLPCEPPDSQQPLERLLITTKSNDTLTALQSISHRLTTSSQVYLFQNGLGSHFDILDYLKSSRVPNIALYAASTTEGANRPTNGEIIHAGRGQTWFGALNAIAKNSGCGSICDLFNQAGFRSNISEDIWAILWKKLAINCGINPYTAICQCRNGDILQQPLFLDTIDELSRELELILQVAGYPEDHETIKARIISVATATAANVSSMLQDIYRGKSTEILAINGFVAKFAAEHGLNAKINEQLTQRVLSLPASSKLIDSSGNTHGE
ncbi:2-dehydropantoate 2-reductase [Hahella ganghwensis]|uniref:2-dehydropantoate 2-reductase n=1 Tax=Hahella ganghwensis TaxID=286420 RepID=UPI000374604C|nr:2-dehydropantoate 2-reductase [Hahella ganghwensis]